LHAYDLSPLVITAVRAYPMGHYPFPTAWTLCQSFGLELRKEILSSSLIPSPVRSSSLRNCHEKTSLGYRLYTNERLL